MIKFENTFVSGWEAAIRGMRNPMNSWAKSDTVYGTYWGEIDGHKCVDSSGFSLGSNDLSLMQSLNKAGTDHAKFMRFIDVTVDITAPLYWWKEFDTYKVGTVANSCSTMHKIHAKEFTIDDFSHEHLTDSFCLSNANNPINALEHIIECLNFYEKSYIDAAERLKREGLTDAERKHIKAQQKYFWWQMIQLLPTSYNQKRTVHLNYQVIKAMYHARKNHKLDEWSIGFINWVKTLPYSKELITGEE